MSADVVTRLRNPVFGLNHYADNELLAEAAAVIEEQRALLDEADAAIDMATEQILAMQATLACIQKDLDERAAGVVRCGFN